MFIIYHFSGLDNGGTSRSSDTDPGGQLQRPLTGKSEITLDELSDLYNRCSDEDEEDGNGGAANVRPETPSGLLGDDETGPNDDGRRLLRQFQANHGSREDLLRTNNNNNSRKKVNRLSRKNYSHHSIFRMF